MIRAWFIVESMQIVCTLHWTYISNTDCSDVYVWVIYDHLNIVINGFVGSDRAGEWGWLECQSPDRSLEFEFTPG